jgi:diguanylate cyclase (GGDEF)-like protein/PAS domain S-box-containing protein
MAPMTDDRRLGILFVDDSPEDTELAVLELERDGFVFDWRRVDSGEELGRCLSAGPVDLVISDFSMPGFGGKEAFRICRERVPEVPFIFFSGTIGEERAIELIRSGATDYVLKDNLKRFTFAVRRALNEAEERRRARKSEQDRLKLAAIVEATGDCVAIVGIDRRFLYLNAAGRALTGLAGEDPSDIDLFSSYDEDSRQRLAEIWPGLAEAGTWSGEAVMLGRTGERIPVAQTVVAHRDREGSTSHYSIIARDLRDRQAYEARIRYLANHDGLTGLPNRSLLSERAGRVIAGHERPVALLVIDLDRFKLINDGYGHAVGDAVLRAVGRRLVSLTREGETAARLGADTFALLWPDPGPREVLAQRAHDVLGALRMPYEAADGQPIHASASMGVSLHPADGEDFESLYRNADAAMHRAKEVGRNDLQFYSAEMTRAAAERAALERDLRGAVADGLLELHYQPQLDLASGLLTGVEALARWRHPQRGWVSPETFIRIAEDSELILSLGGWALLTACRQLTRWDREGLTVPRVAVNVSSRQFVNADFVGLVEQSLRDAGLEPQRLELELTESVLLEDRAKAMATLVAVNRLGVTVSVDDFGSGYSSLSYLSQLPVGCLKIDRSFIQGCTTDRRCKSIVQSIVSLSNALGLRIVAEGIETGEQLDYLKTLGCHEGQGYLFSRPLPAGGLAAFMAGSESAPNGGAARRG